ncbi:MAG: outer membrane protein assembly factor BamB family protein [Planctomycetota bacterium]
MSRLMSILLAAVFACMVQTCLAEPLWHVRIDPAKRRIWEAWYTDSHVWYNHSPMTVVKIINVETGQHELPLTELSKNWPTHVLQDPQVPEKVYYVSTQSLVYDTLLKEPVRTIRQPMDYRIRPVHYNDNIIFPNGYRSLKLISFDKQGRIQWTCQMPGYVMSHPISMGPLMVAQTRQSSYGGQATFAVNLNDGTILWKDVTNAYGSGVVFSDDAQYTIEANSWMAPGKAGAHIYCRVALTGEVIWKRILDKYYVYHRPLLDTNTNLVYILSDSHGDNRHNRENALFCFVVANGELMWKVKLTKGIAIAKGGYSYEPYYPCMQFYKGRILLCHEDNTIGVYDPQNGMKLHTVYPESYLPVPRKRPSNQHSRFLLPPTILHDKLILVTRYNVMALDAKVLF